MNFLSFEVPVTRFVDHLVPLGKPLSLVAVSGDEMEHILDTCHRMQRGAVTIVLHSNEFTRTDRLWRGREPDPMRLVLRRFQRLCTYLVENAQRFVTRWVTEASVRGADPVLTPTMPKSSIHRTVRRWLGHAVSRYY